GLSESADSESKHHHQEQCSYVFHPCKLSCFLAKSAQKTISQLSSPAAKAAFDVASDGTTEARALIRTKPRLRAIPAMTRDSGDPVIVPGWPAARSRSCVGIRPSARSDQRRVPRRRSP